MDLLSKSQLTDLCTEINSTIASLNLEEKKSRFGELQTESMEENFWKDTNRARIILSEMDAIKAEIDEAAKIKEEIDLFIEMFDGSKEEEQNELIPLYETLLSRFNQFQVLKFLSGKYDPADVILSIHAGQGGTEANDWAQMLMRMYIRYAERMGWKADIIHMVQGTEAGISTATLNIQGRYAFGKLKREAGTHRLIRLSPFNAQNLRQTSFAGVEVIPVIEDDDTDIVIKSEDLDIKAVRAGGAGGQHVNKTSSAIQLTHIPTGITVHSSERRDQSQNRKTALTILKAKLWQLEEEKRDNEMKDIKGEHKIAGWGNQIRNYVLHPYKLVKDLRTGIETSNAEKVLDGDLEAFVEAQVRLQ
ncbi:MAG: Peptide chain release factor 2 [candidate division WS6 bacterium GW2011_GWF2_39_15]|uniref:Peptide chain release factor 2 n=1 Tax=candidate division WS6 bacterium GW2011_GWF2_39_15 TaxID=1619100 RepID=A0A0G0QWK8_9BACT|nr:MAG: Peptide chain release factor 2 [candidate division WS6 bacterium GW2011_GWF2_39_15]